MTADLQTLELGNARVRLRTDLRFTLHRNSTSQWYVIEDDSRGQYFRIGRNEYAFLSLLDGRRTLDEAQAELASLPGGFSLDEQHVTGVAKWMIDAGLVESYASHDEQAVSQVHRSERDRQLMGWLNPISWRFSLFNPDSILQFIHRRTAWMPGLPLTLAWILTVMIGFGMLSLRWQDFQPGSLSSVSSHDAFWFGLTWLLMKTVHELAHGLACKRFGGRVPQFGVLLLLLVPSPYVDVTSSWRFAHKYQRVLTAAAGMLAEVMVAAIAAIIWCRSEPGPLQYHTSHVILAGTINTLFFNLNPLMRFDGYYILTDWLNLPNLATRAQQTVVSFSKHIFFATRLSPSDEALLHRRLFVYAYGWIALGWQILVCVGLAIATANIFPGVGLVLVTMAMVVWLGLPLWRLIRYLMRSDHLDLPSRRRFTMITAGLVAVTGLVLLAPAPATIRAPIVIRQDLLDVRAISGGQVAQIHVVAGQFARQGDLLVTLSSPELEMQLHQTNVQLRTTSTDAARNLADGDIALWQLGQEHLGGLQRRQKELQFLVDSLKIRAQSDGVVLLNDTDMMLGQFVQPGDELLQLRRSDACRAVALVAQSDVRWLREARDPNVRLLVWGQGGRRIPSTLATVHPRASFDLPHAAFASTLGGPISVLDRQQVNNARDNRADSLLASASQAQTATSVTEDNGNATTAENRQVASIGRNNQSLNSATKNLRTAQPYVQVELKLTSPPAVAHDNSPEIPIGLSSPEYYDGQTGIMFASSRNTTLGQYLGSGMKSWLKSRMSVSHGL